jgi:uncharacterized membrane protein
LKKYLLLTAAVGFFFVIQVVRDATSFSILIFGLSLIVLTSQRSSRRKNKLIITSVFLTIFATLFKPIFAPIVALVFVLFMGKGQNYKSNFIRIGVALVIAVAPLNLDNLLSKNFNLKSTQPEQQLFIYEFSKIYCWGHDTSPNILAKRSLSRFILTNSDFESVCASLEPAGWDHLRSKIPNVANSPSLAPLMDVNSDLVSVLIRDWLKIILSNPFEWLQIKSVDYSQVLFMANSFQIPEIIDDKSNFLPKS